MYGFRLKKKTFLHGIAYCLDMKHMVILKYMFVYLIVTMMETLSRMEQPIRFIQKYFLTPF